MSGAREAALRVLTAVDRGRRTLPDAVHRERSGLSDPRDRGLLLELAAGTLRWRNALDAVIASASHRPLDDLTPPVRAILRMGAFQLRHLDRIPPHAVVHESVELTRRLGHARAAGFVNAVLRRLARRDDDTVLPTSPGPQGPRADQIRYLSVTLSHPAWLVTRWLDRYGFDSTEAWCRFNNRPPELAVRVRSGSSDELDRAAREPESGLRPSRYLSGAYVAETGALSRLPAGLIDTLVVQDEGSQLVAHSVPVPRTGRILDLCAAPGNKTVILAARASAAGALSIVACDRRPARLALLSETLRAAGVAAPIVQLDAARPLPFAPAFDLVLLDAPCSGLGTVRRDPDLKWSRQPSDLERLARDQARMIRAAAGVVRPGGRLVYATCSSEPEENDAIVDALLASAPGCAEEPVVPGLAVRPAAGLVDPGGRLRTLPFRHDLDAFFAAVLVRRQAA